MLTFLITITSIVIAAILSYRWGYRDRMEDEASQKANEFHTEEEPEKAPWDVDFLDYVIRHQYWSQRAFGPARPKTDVPRLLSHIRKELVEIEQHPQDCEEWVDPIILCIDGAWRSGHSAYTIASTLKRKQEKNMIRKWTIPSDPTTPIEHDRTAETPCPVHPHVHDMQDGVLEFHGRSNLGQLFGRDERETNP